MDPMWLLSLLLSQLCVSASLDPEYHFVAEPMSWPHAQTCCRKHFSDLASVTDMKDLEKLKSAARGHTDTWIGLHRTSNNRTWFWSQPTVAYNAADFVWVSEDDDDEGGANDCVNMDTSGRLKGIPCDEKTSCFICFDDSYTTFMYTDDPKTWLGAQRFCRTHYTDLISGKAQEILFRRKYNQGVTCLIGLSRDDWGWSDGSYSTFRNWNSVWNNATKRCATLGEEGRWESEDCGLKKSFICQGPPKKTSKILVKVKMSSFVDFNPLDPMILEQLQEHFKANNLGHVKLSMSKARELQKEDKKK